MKTYYVLSYDDTRDDLESIADYEMGNFDLTVFWTGQKFEGEIPADVRLWISEGEPADYLPNPLSWPIVSERFYATIEPLVSNACQFVPPPIYRANSAACVGGYRIMNVTCRIAAANRGAGGEISVADLRLESCRVPDDVHLFRLAESSTVLVVSSTFLNYVSGKGLKGFAFVPTTVEGSSGGGG